MEVNLIDQWWLIRDIAGVSRWRFDGVEFSDEEIAFIQKAKSEFMKSQGLIHERLIQLGRIPDED